MNDNNNNNQEDFYDTGNEASDEEEIEALQTLLTMLNQRIHNLQNINELDDENNSFSVEIPSDSEDDDSNNDIDFFTSSDDDVDNDESIDINNELNINENEEENNEMNEEELIIREAIDEEETDINSIEQLPLTYNYLLTKDYIPPNENELLPNELVLPLIVGNIILRPNTTAPFILYGALCGTVRQLLRSTNGILRACIIHRKAFQIEEGNDIYGCIGNVVNYENKDDSICIVFKGIKRCRLIQNEGERTVIPIGRVEILPDPRDISHFSQFDQLRGQFGYLHWKLNSLQNYKQQLIDFVINIEGKEKVKNLNIVMDNYDFLNSIIPHLPLSDENQLNLQKVDTIEDAFEILMNCLNSTHFNCKRCFHFGYTTQFCTTQNIFSMSSNGVNSNHVNPGGYTFTVTTALRCSNLMIVSRPSPEFSWFEGYCWEIIVCGKCGNHVGWRFSTNDQSRKPKAFYGLKSDSYILSQ